MKKGGRIVKQIISMAERRKLSEGLRENSGSS
jgi:hypothetical protein